MIKTPAEIQLMRDAGRIVAEILELLKEKIVEGISTLELEDFAVKETKKRNAVPAFKGYAGFPYALCCSPNNCVIHGMPNKDPLCNGDILSIDFGVQYKGYFGDSAFTIAVGEITSEAAKLMAVTEQSLYKGIACALTGGRLFDISAAVQNQVEKNGFSVVRDFVGHGIGRKLHEDPRVPNYGVAGRGLQLKPGMVLAIEPMVNQGVHEVKVMADGWTVVTADGKLSAHFEHTVAITESGPEILTTV